jgi:hypothetical protein
MTWMNLKPLAQLDNDSYAMHGDIRMINVPLSTLTVPLEDVPTEVSGFAQDQVRGCYQSMTESFDFYPGDQVIWDPYSAVSIAARYPGGLSIMCRRD